MNIDWLKRKYSRCCTLALGRSNAMAGSTSGREEVRTRARSATKRASAAKPNLGPNIFSQATPSAVQRPCYPGE